MIFAISIGSGILIALFFKIRFLDSIEIDEGLSLGTSIILLIFGIFAGAGRWFTSTHDKKKEFEDEFNRKNEMRFTNAVKDLSSDDKMKKSLGLLEIRRLEDEGFDRERIKIVNDNIKVFGDENK